MTQHPYWSYGPDQGRPVLAALDEGRRAFALECAMATTLDDRGGQAIVRRAQVFEAYLAGKTETAAERLADLEKSERKLIALEVAGVDNWSGYDNAVADLDDET